MRRQSSGAPPPSGRREKAAAVEDPAWGSRSVDIFQKLEQIGEGTYGQVYRARNRQTDEIVALKKIKLDKEREGFPITAIREIRLLKGLNHDNVVRLKEIVTSSNTNPTKGSIYMVFEYMDHDLQGLRDSGYIDRLKEAQIKCYVKQLLNGLHYVHKNKVLHRDIKASNLLVGNDGTLKIADFGLARPYNEAERNYTNRVITLWYRPPELLLGGTQYGPAIDMWSVGCILAELLLQKPVFPGKDEVDQLYLVFRLCGTPDETTWPGVSKLPFYKWRTEKGKKSASRLRQVFRKFPPQALDLVEKMLSLDPAKRITASEALDHDWFWSDPMPCKLAELPKCPRGSFHEYQTKKKRDREREARVPLNKRPRGVYEGKSGDPPVGRRI